MNAKQMALITTINLVTVLSFAAQGTIEARVATNRKNTLDIVIQGPVAKQISDQLTKNGIKMFRDSFSGASVQLGKGIRCIDKGARAPLYCYVALVGSAIE